MELLSAVELDKMQRPEAGCQNFHSTWLPDATRLCRDSSGWTLVLAFDTVTHLAAQAARRSCHGIDIGVNPLATVANGYGHHWQVPGLTPRVHRDDSGSTREAHLRSRLLHLAMYRAAQRQFEALIARLLREASSVVVEQLSLDELRRRIGRDLDDRAVIDFLYALLPQRLNLVRIPLIRHPAAYTSQMCSRCYGYGLRQLQTWTILRCSNCDTEHDANINAAQVLVHVGSYYALQRLRNNMGGEPHVHHRAL